MLGKLAALIGAVVVVHLFATLAGMITQLLNGYTRLEPMVYLTYFIIPSALQFIIWGCIAMLVHVLVNNKYLGFFVFIVIFILNAFGWSGLDVESNLVRLNGSSGMQYSDMSGFGPFLKNWLFFRAYWLLAAGLLIYVGYLFLVRGNDTTFRWRAVLAKGRFRSSWPVALVLGGAWVVMAGFGYYNTKVLNTYRTSDEAEEDQVRYERTYKRYEHGAAALHGCRIHHRPGPGETIHPLHGGHDAEEQEQRNDRYAPLQRTAPDGRDVGDPGCGVGAQRW
ncbi:MAG: hypothetical protein IPG74_06295 [Flavobacteriales bacterium]|nr:hypothetical protein [Flavobacteriales bacterium]